MINTSSVLSGSLRSARNARYAAIGCMCRLVSSGIADSLTGEKNNDCMLINMNVNKRIRRTPAESKSLILETAAKRLAELGLDGLNISGVAKAAGMSHATVIHHFGSTSAMREALLQQMTNALLSDVISALREDVSHDQILGRLFSMLSQDGHGRLLAWLALDHQDIDVLPAKNNTSELFKSIIQAIPNSSDTQGDAKLQVFLVATAAMGLSICGGALSDLIGLSDEESAEFPKWLARHLRSFA